MPANATIKRSPEIQSARATLWRKGWTQTAAAQRLGVSREHFSHVMNGRRLSRRLLAAIQELPENPA
jgi:transcriptional regulator with XRE-family HTH domain